MLDLKTAPPLSLYVHIPWCVKKCPYCDFNSHVRGGGLPEKEYVAALLRDLELELPDIWGRSIISVFIGGGTPSLFSAASIDSLLGGLRARLNLAPDIEITLEANPGAVEQQRFNEYRACGINRISIGAQSFNARHLQSLGRIHDEREAARAVATAQQAGFENINIDLMYGLPGQTVQEAIADIERAVSLEPAHISHYQLTIEPNTAFFHRPPILPADDGIWDMQQQCQALLQVAGYTQYEVSAYARAHRRCVHNMNYWQFGDYVGIGAGAHQKLTLLNKMVIQRRWKQRLPEHYLSSAMAQKQHIEGEAKPTRDELKFEFMLNALRLTDGFETPLFYERTGIPLASVTGKLQEAEQRELLTWNHKLVKPTELGKRFLNELLLMFMEETPA
ncbi:MAG TPA: radical SAM family heme chaperone HemW [Gammaproteobacteria bacterium]|nr:radical SAM family heme chaperone HemW [Gammaproteobacteria bacterium]